MKASIILSRGDLLILIHLLSHLYEDDSGRGRANASRHNTYESHCEETN